MSTFMRNYTKGSIDMLDAGLIPLTLGWEGRQDTEPLIYNELAASWYGPVRPTAAEIIRYDREHGH